MRWTTAPNGQRCTAPVEWYPAVAVVELTRRGWVWSIEVDGRAAMGGRVASLLDGRWACRMVIDWEIRTGARRAGAMVAR